MANNIEKAIQFIANINVGSTFTGAEMSNKRHTVVHVINKRKPNCIEFDHKIRNSIHVYKKTFDPRTGVLESIQSGIIPLNTDPECSGCNFDPPSFKNYGHSRCIMNEERYQAVDIIGGKKLENARITKAEDRLRLHTEIIQNLKKTN